MNPTPQQDALQDVWLALTALAKASGTPCIKDQVWHYKISDKWEIWINGNKVKAAGIRSDGRPTSMLNPYEAYIEFNGWPAGIMTPFESMIAHGTIANIFTLRDAIRAAIKKANQERRQPADAQPDGGVADG